MIDLHSHTWFSDGALSPEALVHRAAGNGVRYLAITDHDCTDALAESDSLQAALLESGVRLIPGVEISTLWLGREIHILGLLVDVNDPTLKSLLQKQQQLRRARAGRIGEQLKVNGIDGLSSYLDALPCKAVGRNHIAEFLISTGHASDKQQAFRKHLGNKGKYHSQAEWCDIPTAVSAIRSAGGISAIAHPERYKLSNGKLKTMIAEFREAGGECLEVSYSNLAPEQLNRLAGLCEQMDLWASLGSDFHSPEATWMDVGKIRYLPPDCRARAVWKHPSWPAHLAPA